MSSSTRELKDWSVFVWVSVPFRSVPLHAVVVDEYDARGDGEDIVSDQDCRTKRRLSISHRSRVSQENGKQIGCDDEEAFVIQK